MKNTFAIIALLAMSSCAHYNCKTDVEEPVSTCRAEWACGGHSAGHAFAVMAGGFSQGYSGGRNNAQDQYNQCLNRDLSAQKINFQTKLEIARMTSSQP